MVRPWRGTNIVGLREEAADEAGANAAVPAGDEDEGLRHVGVLRFGLGGFEECIDALLSVRMRLRCLLTNFISTRRRSLSSYMPSSSLRPLVRFGLKSNSCITNIEPRHLRNPVPAYASFNNSLQYINSPAYSNRGDIWHLTILLGRGAE